MIGFYSKLNLTAKFIPPILGVVSLVLITSVAYVGFQVKHATEKQIILAKESLEAEQKSAKERVLDALEKKADTIGKFMAETAPDLIFAFDFISLQTHQQVAMADKDIVYSAYLKPDGIESFTEYEKPPDLSSVIERKYPIYYDGEKLGYVLHGLSTTSVTSGIEQSNARIGEAITRIGENGQSFLTRYVVIMSISTVATLLLIGLTVFGLFKITVLKPTKETLDRIGDLAKGNGDLTIRLPIAYDDEIGCLRSAVNDFVEKLHKMMASTIDEVDRLVTQADELKESGNKLNQFSSKQSDSAAQIATSASQMNVSSHEIAKSTSDAYSLATTVDGQVVRGKEMVAISVSTAEKLAEDVTLASDVIKKLADESDNIGAVLDVIKSIADKTNLLALNAAIEAARAGEQGRGFAVVADEVRTLASHTQRSTQDIQEMIGGLQNGAKEAVNVILSSRSKADGMLTHSSEVGNALEDIREAVNQLNNRNLEIARSTEEQSTTIDEMNRSIKHISEQSRQTAQIADKSARFSHNLTEVAKRLQNLTDQFKT